MRKVAVLLALLFWVSADLWAQKENKPETLVRWSFVGTKQLSTLKDLQPLREILALNETSELRKVGAEGFANIAAARFTKSSDTNQNAAVAALIKPLLQDLVEFESRLELTSRGAQDADWILAVKLPHERGGEWSKNLSDLASAAKMRASKMEGEGWTAELDNYRMSFSPTKEWVIIEGGSGKSGTKGFREFRTGLGKRSGKQVLSAELNLPQLAQLWNGPPLEHAPKLDIKVTPRHDGLRSEMEIEYPRPLNISPEAWNPPKELIHEPLIGFSALQGVGDRLAQSPQFRSLSTQKTPNQIFSWSQSSTPFTVFAAADVGNPGDVISNFVVNVLPGITNLPGKINVLTNRPGILWRGLPVVTPFAEAADAGQSPFLLAGLFPIAQSKTNVVPPELFAQLKKKNLVYYEWEITQERMKQWRPIWQFAQILQHKLFQDSISDKWIEAITPHLVNTVTEVTLENPRRLKLVRQSQCGLNALELVLLAHALDPRDVIERPAGSTPPRSGQARPAQPRRPAPAAPSK